MRDDENINAMISELEQISGWFYKINNIDSEMKELLPKKEKEIDATNSKYKTVDSVNIHLERLPHLKVLIDEPLNDFAPLFPPQHWQDVQAAEDKKSEALIEKWVSDEGKEKLYNVFREYDNAFLSVAEGCEAEYNKAKALKAAKLDEIETKYNKKRNELVTEKKHLKHQLNGTTLIPKELFEDADRISSMLKLKRADTLKEAINLALDEKRKDHEEFERRWHERQMEQLTKEELRAKKEQAAVAQYQADTIKATIEAQCYRCVKQSFCSHGLNRPLNCKDFERR